MGGSGTWKFSRTRPDRETRWTPAGRPLIVSDVLPKDLNGFPVASIGATGTPAIAHPSRPRVLHRAHATQPP